MKYNTEEKLLLLSKKMSTSIEILTQNKTILEKKPF